MSLIDWLIVLIPVAGVIGFGWYTRRFVIGVSDYLVAGRVCNRYVITTGNLANALGLVTLIGFIEIRYRNGFALTFWDSATLPIEMIIALSTASSILRKRWRRPWA